MSHIVSFEIHGLAGRTDPLSIELNRDTNVFFGLNGSGKTSLLKILHAAMANETNILDAVPFTTAEVRIHSLNWNKVFTRSIEKKQRVRRGRTKPRSAVHREVRIENEVVLAAEPSAEEGMKWTCTPATPKEVSSTRWAHQYLPTSRLHVSDEPFPPYFERPPTGSAVDYRGTARFALRAFG